MQTNRQLGQAAAVRWLATVCLSLLLAIAALAIGGQVIVQRELRQQARSTAAVRIAELQRSLSQRLTTTALGLQSAVDPREHRALLRDLQTTLTEWDRVEQDLTRRVSDQELFENGHEQLLRILNHVQPHFHAMSRAAHAVIAAAYTGGGTDLAARVEILVEQETQFLAGMNAILSTDSREADARIGALQRTELALGGFTLVLLLGMGTFALRPAIRKVGTAIDELERADTMHQRLAAIVETSEDAIISKTASGIVLSWNRAAEQIYGYSAADMIGRSISLVIPPERAHELPDILARIQRGERVDHFETVQLHKNGTRIDVDLTISPMRDAAGHIHGASTIARDITSRKRAETALAEEAQITAALARVSRETIAELTTGALLDRLCGLTAEVLGCDFSHTWLWHVEQGTSIAVAGHGDRPGHADTIRWLNLAPAPGDAPDDADVWEVTPPDTAELGGPRVVGSGVTRVLYMKLRRGGEVVGVHSAGYRGRMQPFTSVQHRIAAGIGQLASMALEHARLVDELERANRVKSDFVAIMSHELRHSLGTMLGYVDLLHEGQYGPLGLQVEETLRKIGKAGWESVAVITATLDISRDEATSVPLETEPTSVPALLDELASDLQARLGETSARLVWDVPVGLPALRTDPVKLKMVLANLIGNAIKYAPVGAVTIGARPSRDGVELHVSDTGIGIKPEARSLIFDAFQQADRSSVRRNGVGLGLFIVRRLLNALSGTIELDSEVGRGTTFRVWIPADAADRAAA